jgi:hypothetical protein
VLEIGETIDLRLGTEGDPVGVFLAHTAAWTEGRKVWSVAVFHTDGCPCLDGGLLGACACSIFTLRATRVA